MRDVEPAGGCQYHSMEYTRRWLRVPVRPTRKNQATRHILFIQQCFYKAEIKLSGKKVAARFACGAESLAASAVCFMWRDNKLRRQDFHCHIYVRLRQFAHVTFPRVSLTGILELDTLSSIIYS